MRLGDTVAAVLVSPVADGPAARLFTVPAGFWPARGATWSVPETAWVSASGLESSEALGPSFDLRVHRDGTVTHVPSLRPVGHVATVTWRTTDPEWMEPRGPMFRLGGRGGTACGGTVCR